MNDSIENITLSVVIPAFNEKENINHTIEEILEVIDSMPNIDEYQIIVVDDHSSDNTFDLMRKIQNPKIICLRLSRQSGSMTALRAGIAEAKGDVVLCISADGQDDASSLKTMLNKWQNGADIVWALRKKRDNERIDTLIMSKIFYRILNWLTESKDSSIDMSNADYCLLDKRVVDAVNSCHEKNTSLFGLISWLGFNQDFVQYDRRKRKRGVSKWSFRNRLNFAKDWIVAFSGLPLKMMTVVGFFVSVIGFIYAILIIWLALFSKMPVRGWPTTMIIILIIGGIQMIMLGTIGEYLWRNLDESRKRPLYLIERSTLEELIDK